MERERTREREIITKDVDNDRNEKHHREGHKELENYVGFANLPNQVYRKSVKRGFEFNLMVVGKHFILYIFLFYFYSLLRKLSKNEIKHVIASFIWLS